MDEVLRPATDWEMKSIVSQLAEQKVPVEVVGHGSKRPIGRPVQAAAQLTTAGLRGITLYEPAELVMSARGGTPLSQVEAELASRGQMLAFEPIDYGFAIGNSAGQQTIGAVFAANLSGPRRIATGGARDHLLGAKAVNGRGELFKSGGRVMKNVTGYDVARGLSGSWGTLAVMTEVTFKVMPWPEDAITLVYLGLPDDIAVELLCAAMGSPYEISGTAHLTAGLSGRVANDAVKSTGQAVTAIRIENFAKSVAYRKEKLKESLKVYGVPAEFDFAGTALFWGDLRKLVVVPDSATNLWRISTAPRMAPKIVAAIKRHVPAEAYYDWSGGLIWVEVVATADAGSSDIRRAVAVHGGHATLIRAAHQVRASVEVFPPLSPAVEKLTRGIKAAFDPAGILNPGRMYSGM